tara:strand:- start:78 stop:323 length:246 start_codon:yes stop_codon:yes gene_type:complete
MRDISINAQKSYLTGCINKHIANVEMLLTNPVGIGEHQDVQKSIETELGHIAEHYGKLEMLAKFFVKVDTEKKKEKSNDKN